MNIQARIRVLIKILLENMHEKRKMILVLSCFVVFITTYMLILPAFTLDKEEAAEQGGIDVPGVEQSAEVDTAKTESEAKEDAASEAKEEIKTEAKEEKKTETSAKTDEAKPANDSEAESKASSKVTLQNDESDDFVVAVEGKDAGLSEDMSVAVREIDQNNKKQKEEYESLYNDALEAVQKAQKEEGLEKSTEFAFAKFYDISLMDGRNEVEPDSAVDVKISFSKKLQKELKVTDPDGVHIVHFAVDKETGEVTPEVLDTDTTDITVKNNKVTEAAFTADSFSVFAVVYTVDFEYSVNGKMYQFSLPGGGFVSFTDLVEVLGIAGDTNSGEIGDVEVSEATRKFVADVASVEFSSPGLVDVSKTENETTVGQIKESRGLECEYSAELTEEQIAQINAQTVEAGDWALISLQPFDTEETLTITLKNDEVYTIRITDASYSITAVTNLNGAKGALINPVRKNAVQSTAHSTRGRLQAAAVSIDSAAGTVTTTDPAIQLTEWTFTRVGESGNNYYIHSSAGYLNIDNRGSVTVSSQPQSLRVDSNSNNQIRIRSGRYALNNWGSQTNNGYGTWDGGGENGNNDEWFTVYSIEQIFPVTLHFVKEGGTPFTAGEVTYADGTPVEIVNGNFKIDPEKLVIGTDGIIDLNQFLVNGYTLSNTHKSTWKDINDSTDSYTHSIIGNELKWNNGTVQYRLFYTNHDKAGSYWFDAGTEPVRDSNHWQYVIGSGDPSNHSTVSDNDAHPYDYYLVYDPIPTSSGGSSGHSPSGEPIDDIGKSKTLTPNEDGTYTMDLSVTTHAKGHEESNGINLIIVFDTSSSMRRSTTRYENNEWYQYSATEFKNKKDSRFIQARNALDTFLNDLLPDDNTTTNMVQLALVDFNYNATKHTFNGGTGTPAYWTNRADTFMATLDSLSCPSGTNWAQALDTAKTVAATGDDDPTYILLMTDGAPSQYWDPSSKSNYYVSGEGCYLGARDEARDIVNAGYELYGVFSFGDSTDENNRYLDKLVDYAYNKEVHSDHSYYASDPDKLEKALESIFGMLKERVAHIAVNYQDGIAMDTTSTALSSNVGGNLGSITYSKTGGTTEDYSVTTDANGNAIFKIGDSTYPGGTETITYTKISGSSSDEGGSGITVDENATATVYKCTVGSGGDAKTFYMPIATLETNTSTKVGDLNWDLSPFGMLEEGATYKISFVVWPNQEAYDYVAKLNNGLMTWGEDSTPEPVYAPNSTTLLYYKNGVADYPNIVRYPDGTFAVLTNTMQEVTYYIATEDTFNTSEETTYTGQYTVNPVAPDPMPLTASSSQIEKVWDISRDPDVLAQLLYGDPENPYSIGFDIYQDNNSQTPYTSVRLGWDEAQQKYIWKSDDRIYVKWDETKHKYVTCSSEDEGAKEIGTHWTEDFSIATGLMLSEARMTALGLDKSAYTWTTYPEEGGTKYYLLEEGHDYTISEPNVGYEFDFDAPVYHPMLVDGDLMNVDFENVVKDSNGKVTSYNITEMSSIDVASDGRSALTIVNKLRGYLNLEKRVLDNSGNPDPTDDTEFEFTLTVSNDDGLFEGDHIPWFAVNDCFYHTVDEDGEWHYYQVNKVSTSGADTTWRVTTEEGSSGPTYTFTSNEFDKDVADKQTITCTNINDATDTITLDIFGNQTTPEPVGSNKKIKVTRFIRQDQKLTIGNIPAGSTYTVEESGKYGYVLETTSGNTTGSIVPNSDTDVVFTNRKIGTEVNILKTKETGAGLNGAVFQLRTVKKTEGSKEVEELASVEIGGIDDICIEIDGEEREFKSAFETTGETQTLTNLTDGTYRLYEVYVPAGYINTVSYIEFDVANGTVSCPMAASEETVDFDGTGTISLITITNTPGTALPHTGGMGTTIFYVFGTMLVLGCGIYLIARRRIQRNN